MQREKRVARDHARKTISRSVLHTILVPATTAALAATSADAATWTGANVSAANNPPTKPNALAIDDPNNWTSVVDPSGVPGQSDSAIFNWSTASTSSPNTNVIPIASTAVFNPGSLELNAGTSSSSYVTLDKSLTLSSLKVTGSGTSGGAYQSRLRVGLNNAVTVDLTGSTPFTGLTSWGIINVGSGTNKVVFNLSNANINIPAVVTGGNTQSASTTTNAAMAGGLSLMTAAQLANAPEMRFSAAPGALPATVHLASPGNRAEGTLSLGNVGLFVRSDQTWTGDAASYVRMNYRAGDATAQPFVVASIDNKRLDNLSAVNLVVNGGTTGSSGSSAASGMRLGGGTYGSLRFSGGSTTLRDNHMVMTANVSLVSYIVTPGVYDPLPQNQVNATADSTYGLNIQVGSTNSSSYKYLLLNGNTLDVTNGVLINDLASARTDAATMAGLVDASGGTLNVGGPVVITSLNHGPDGRATAANRTLTRAMGLRGNATTVINLGNSYSNRVASLNAAGLQTATLNMVGGASTARTFEVGDAASRVTLAATANFNIGTLNVGTATTAGNVQLVNDYLNDNPIAVGEDPAVKKAGEKLIVGDLNVAANSTLDVNGLPVLLGSAATLSVLPTGTLDLNTGLDLNAGELVITFVGLGDQTGIWNLFASQVIDTDNPDLGFTAVLSGGNTVWQTTLVPEPGMAALALGVLAVGGLRRRRAGRFCRQPCSARVIPTRIFPVIA